MKRLRIVIKCESDAFVTNLSREIEDCLYFVIEQIHDDPEYSMYQTIHDINGNDVGQFRLKDEEEETHG